jgi:outer membrane protein assembly factor BamB
VASSTGITAIAPDGSVRWSQRLGFVAATPALSPTRELVVGTNAGALVTLSSDGQRQGYTLVGGAVRSSPLVLHDGSVVVNAFDQAVHRFDAEGRRVFRVSMNGQTNEPAAWTSDGLLLVPAADWLHVLSPRGDRIASHTVGATIIAGPAVADDGTAWVVAQDGSAHQIEPRGGRRIRTELDISVASDTGIAIGTDGAVRIGGRDDGVVCLGPTGTERWRITGEGGFPGELTIDAAGSTLGVSDTGKLLAIDPSGNVVWRVSLEARAQAAPVLGPDGTVYVATARGTVQAWR